MALTPAVVSSSLQAGSPTTISPEWPLICQGVGIAVVGWVAAGGVVLLGASAPGGFGVVIGTRVFLPPAPALIAQGMVSAGLTGPVAGEIAAAVALGLSIAVSTTASYAGLAGGGPGVVPGADASKIVVANTPLLGSFMGSAFASVGLLGPTAGQLANGLSQGISLMMLTGTGIGVVPAPGTGGPTTSILL